MPMVNQVGATLDSTAPPDQLLSALEAKKWVRTSETTVEWARNETTTQVMVGEFGGDGWYQYHVFVYKAPDANGNTVSCDPGELAPRVTFLAEILGKLEAAAQAA